MTIEIKSSIYPYSIDFESSLQGVINQFRDDGDFFIIDKKIFSHYGYSFEGISESKICLVEATEETKSYDAISPVFEWLINRNIKRQSKLLVISGGTIQDMAAFVATVLFRGLYWEFIPTTLLSQCDSCIGGKSSINVKTYKNQIGTYFPPRKIYIIQDFLKTLSWDDIRSGMGEIVKFNLLVNSEEFDDLKNRLSELHEDNIHEPQYLSLLNSLVIKSLNVKKTFIEEDEFDKGRRLLLNYGHTFGHAYESISNYKIPHGIGVMLGIITATYVSFRLKMVSKRHYNDIKTKLLPWVVPFQKLLKHESIDKLMDFIKIDKKNNLDTVNCILTRGVGKMEIQGLHIKNELTPILNEFLTYEL